MISDADRAGMIVGNDLPPREIVQLLREEGLLLDEDKRNQLAAARQRAVKAESLLRKRRRDFHAMAKALRTRTFPEPMPRTTRALAGGRTWYKIAPATWVITWPPGHGLDFHDHGGSWARFWVVAGVLTESIESPLGVHTMRLTVEDGMAVRHPNVRHRIVNEGSELAISVHRYHPDLTITYDESLEIRP